MLTTKGIDIILLSSKAGLDLVLLKYDSSEQGRIQDFHLGGGGGGGAQQVMCQHAHYERGTELTFGRGPGPA